MQVGNKAARASPQVWLHKTSTACLLCILPCPTGQNLVAMGHLLSLCEGKGGEGRRELLLGFIKALRYIQPPPQPQVGLFSF